MISRYDKELRVALQRDWALSAHFQSEFTKSEMPFTTVAHRPPLSKLRDANTPSPLSSDAGSDAGGGARGVGEPEAALFVPLNARRRRPSNFNSLRHFKSVSESRLFTSDMAMFKKSLFSAAATHVNDPEPLRATDPHRSGSSESDAFSADSTSRSLSSIGTENLEIVSSDPEFTTTRAQALKKEVKNLPTRPHSAHATSRSRHRVPAQPPANTGSDRSAVQCVLRAQVSQPTTSFYMRALPSTCISFASKDGRIIFHQALGGPFMECYYALAMHYVTQSEPAYCGLSTLVMCLNALEVDPLRQWKGVWRWFDESTLETVRDLSEVQVDGITIAEFECMARMNGLTPECRRADSVSKEMFVQDLKRACASQTEIMTISYFRGTLNQTGMGHFSPIGGYNESTNQVLVFDVARFKYSAYWVSADLLWESMLPIDESTGKSRGYCLLSKAKRGLIHSAIGKISEGYAQSWPVVAKALVQELVVKVPLVESFPNVVQEPSFQRASASLISFESQVELYESLPQVNAGVGYPGNGHMGKGTGSIFSRAKDGILELVVGKVLERIPNDFFDLTDNPLFAPPLDPTISEPSSKTDATSPYFPDDMRLHISQTQLYNIVRKEIYRLQKAKMDASPEYAYFTSTQSSPTCSTHLLNAPYPAFHVRSISDNANAVCTSDPSASAVTSTHVKTHPVPGTNATARTGSGLKARAANPHCSKTHAVCECSGFSHGDYFSRCRGHVHGYKDFVAFLTICVASLVSAGQVRSGGGGVAGAGGGVVVGDCVCRSLLAGGGAGACDGVGVCGGSRAVAREVILLRDSFLAISQLVK